MSLAPFKFLKLLKFLKLAYRSENFSLANIKVKPNYYLRMVISILTIKVV